MSYDCKKGYMEHTDKGLFWFGNDGWDGELSGEFTEDEAFEIFKKAMHDAHSVFNKVEEPEIEIDEEED